MEKQSGTLILDGVTFELDDCENTKLYVFESDEYDGTITISFDLYFKQAIFNGEKVSPYICINQHETYKSGINETVGCIYSVDSVEKSDEREDTLYIYEHEPFKKYSFTILEISEKTAHIHIEGIAIIDGYSVPAKTADFSGDFILRYE
ncbi:MAG: hypothetical protein K2N27_09730 [Ruminococcus sp.]|nr:hypothetical protein [Ruminococcus sp.]